MKSILMIKPSIASCTSSFVTMKEKVKDDIRINGLGRNFYGQGNRIVYHDSFYRVISEISRGGSQRRIWIRSKAFETQEIQVTKRLGISYPELTEMQARAIFEAAIGARSQGVKVLPEIMVPLVGTSQESKHQVRLIQDIAETVFSIMGTRINYKVGTMIEIPRAALIADIFFFAYKIAEHAEFFSFGTNDLTQMTFGYSRDDVGKFLPIYLSKGILKNDPFEVLDQKGVGELIKIATERGRKTRPGLKVGICGEHGGEPSSVAFFAEAGLDYVSCSPFRVPIARLAAAQVAL